MKQKYSEIIAEPFQCVSSLLEMIVKEKISIEINQNQFTEVMGLNVPVEYQGSIKNISIVNNPQLYGVVITEKGLAPIFKRLGINLTEEYHNIFKFQDWEFADILKKNLDLDRAIIVGFSYGKLYNKEDLMEIGHACLVTNIENQIVSIYDPGPKDFGFKEIDITDLYNSVKVKKNGVWIIY